MRSPAESIPFHPLTSTLMKHCRTQTLLHPPKPITPRPRPRRELPKQEIQKQTHPSVVVLISSARQIFSNPTLLSQPHHLHSSLHPLSLSFTAFQDIPVPLVHIVPNSLSLSTPRARMHLDIKRLHEPHAVRGELRHQVLRRSAEWIRRWCSVAESIVLVDINSKMRLPSFITFGIRHFTANSRFHLCTAHRPPFLDP
ncbi:hypothetical protein BLNAU_12375 [Blattamonas nauphoetae]|uniref:Uncharacterized protein n=1 Tax=Blattamonas nauphoetae TaxID=2049346 RepID=A0ABQ9XL21_9EUKA|nr:hypothetical protein BLNAU_12375 [Blattamonas nauphoetae]